MDDVTRALLGDLDAAERITDQWIPLSCPRCGGSWKFRVTSRSERGAARGWGFHIGCTECGCRTNIYYVEMEIGADGRINFVTDERKKALLEWNTRPRLLTPEQMDALERMDRK